MQRSTLTLILLLICICRVQPAFTQEAPIPVYYTAVDMPDFLQNQYYGLMDTRLIAEDLADLLGKAEGRVYVAKPAGSKTGRGIWLELDTKFPHENPEAGEIRSDGNGSIRFRSKYITGLSYAVYAWLEELGFSFYLPGETWTHIPKLESVLKKPAFQKTYAPAFPMRMFLASGGLYAVKGLDDQKQIEKDWRVWHRRNRAGCAYIVIDGHVGEAFNLAHRETIEKDPAILAPVNGKSAYRTDGKIDPTNARAVKLFNDWVINEHKKKNSRWPWFLPPQQFASADAGDGLNYCHTEACHSAFPGVSDQSFHIINQAAKQIRQSIPGAGISTLAYTERADTPVMRIEPNVHVMVVPTAFQQVTTAANLMQRWAKKAKHISQYDYLNIGVWAWEKPFFNFTDYHAYLQFLKGLGVEGMHYETSFSKFSSGILQYLILRYLNKPFSDPEAELALFCSKNFGPASEKIIPVLKAWYFSNQHLNTNYDHPSFYEDELGYFLQKLDEAGKVSGLNRDQQSRIRELKGYAVYLCQYYELFAKLDNLDAYSKNPARKEAKATEILEYTWSLYPTRIFQNTQLNDLCKALLPEAARKRWDYHQPGNFARPATSVEQLIEQAFTKYRQLYAAHSNYVQETGNIPWNDWVKMSADSIRIQTMDEAAFGHFIYPFHFYASKGGSFRLTYTCSASQKPDAYSNRVALVSVESRDYRFMDTRLIRKGDMQGEMIFQLPAAGHYRVFLSQYQATPVRYVLYPRNQVFYHEKKSILMNGMQMQEAVDPASYPNRYIAFMRSGNEPARFSHLYPSSTNTSFFYAPSGRKLSIQPEPRPGFFHMKPEDHNPKQPFLWYENSVYRWPLVLQNGPGLYLFLKKF